MMQQKNLLLFAAVAVVVAILMGGLAANNYSAAQQLAESRGGAVTVGEVAAVGIPSLASLGALVGGIISLVKMFVPAGGGETLKILQAIAVLLEAGAGGQLKQIADAFKQHGLPPHGVIELQWEGGEPHRIAWGQEE